MDSIQQDKKLGIVLIIGIVILPVIFSWFTLKKCYSTKSKVISMLWMVIFIAISLSNNNSSSVTSSRDAINEKNKDFPRIDIYELANEYKQNEARADRDHKGKTYLLTGTVTGIDKDFMDDTVIRLKGTNPFLNITATLMQSKPNLDKAYQLNKEDTIEIVCTVKGELMTLPRLEDCYFL